jgi:hypothetical protein
MPKNLSFLQKTIFMTSVTMSLPLFVMRETSPEFSYNDCMMLEVTSLLQCASLSGQLKEVTFFYRPTNKTCRLGCTVIHSAGSLDSGWQHYGMYIETSVQYFYIDCLNTVYFRITTYSVIELHASILKYLSVLWRHACIHMTVYIICQRLHYLLYRQFTALQLSINDQILPNTIFRLTTLTYKILCQFEVAFLLAGSRLLLSHMWPSTSQRSNTLFHGTPNGIYWKKGQVIVIYECYSIFHP